MASLAVLLSGGCEQEQELEPTPVLASTEAALLQKMPSDALAAPADYDGDGCTDISTKGSNGIWYIDYCANGWGGAWDAAYFNYGDDGAIPVPADYDGDGKADLSVKDASGMWGVDYAANGFGVFDVQVFGYGLAGAVPVPADYDGDGKADLSVKDSSGMWGVDHAADGFNGWNDMHPQYNYGGASWIPVPGYYSGNGRCSATPTQVCSLSSQCPSGERCFLKADLAVKTTAGAWLVDKSSNGLGAPCVGAGCTRPQWDIQVTGYGDATAVPLPADYDHDGFTDLSVKNANGTWYVDKAGVTNGGGTCTSKPCFGGWNLVLPHGYGGGWATGVPGDYTRDGNPNLDLSVKDANGFWLIDNVGNGYGAWDPPSAIDNAHRPELEYPNAPFISATKLYRPSGAVVGATNGRLNLTIGVRYTVEVTVDPGPTQQNVFVQVNPSLHVPGYLNLENPYAPTNGDITERKHRWFSVTCSQPGAGMLGFALRNAQTGVVFNKDHGVVVACNPPTGHPTGLHGVVSARGCSKATCGTGINGICGHQASTDGHYIPGCPLKGATVSVPGFPAVITGSDGSWSIPSATGGPLTVTVTCNSASCTSVLLGCSGISGPRSSTKVVKVTVPPGSGVQVDTPLEEQFFAPGSPMSYTTFIDYSRGRTIFHTVATQVSGAAVRALRNPSGATMVDLANQSGVPVMLNGGFFDQRAIHPGNPVAYFYSGGAALGCRGYATLGVCRDMMGQPTGQACYVDEKNAYFNPAVDYTAPGECPSGELCSTHESAEVLAVSGTMPMLTIRGMNAGAQTVSMPEVDASFWHSDQFSLVGNPPCPLYDLDNNEVSDVDYAVQAAGGPPLVENGVVTVPYDPNDVAWARTAVGVSPGGHTLYYVVADGEGVNGGHGATWYQVGAFFHDALAAENAMMLDGGLSTELVLRGTRFGGVRHVNTLTGEDHSWDVNPFVDPPGITESANCPGSVANFLTAGQ